MPIFSLKFQTALVKQLFDEIPASVIVMDNSGKILAVNKYFLAYTSKDAGSMVGRNLFDSREMKDPELKIKYRALLKNGKPFYSYGLKHYAELQGRWYHMWLSAVPIKDEKGKVVGAVSMAQDRTALHNAQKQLEQANQQLSKRLNTYAKELLEKQMELKKVLASRNQFFADASHELRTPLTIMKGNIDLIRMQAKSDPLPVSLKNKIEEINGELRRMSELLEDITTLNRMDEFSCRASYKDTVDFKELIKKEVGDLQALAKNKKINLKVNLKPVEMLGEARSLRKLVRNLLSNAIRYTPTGGTVSLALKKNAKQQLTFIVKDTGIGISQQDLPNIFDRFYRASKVRNRQDGGSGLGLSICKHVVMQHHGNIGVKSQLGKGTEFKVILPLVV